MTRWAVLLFPFLLSGCGLWHEITGLAPKPCDTTSVDGFVLCGWEPLVPPFEYEVEFSDARQCITVANANGNWGRPRNLRYEQVTWMQADSIRRGIDDTTAGAITETNRLRITVARPYLEDMRVIFHESLHAWLGSSPTHGEGSFAFCDPFRTPQSRAPLLEPVQ